MFQVAEGSPPVPPSKGNLEDYTTLWHFFIVISKKKIPKF